MADSKEILLAFYGDDFTGSTDALEFLSRAGAKTVLFLGNPTKEQLAQFEGVVAIGMAGMTRAMDPVAMSETLTLAFKNLKELNPKHVHYKVCSTFDSSPEIGNIGTAIAVGKNVFKNAFTPILVAAPNLGRYSAFGNLFARMGIGSQGAIYRLDEHPSMSKHPITPAHESDLRTHLSFQTDRKMGLVDLQDLTKSKAEIKKKIHSLIGEHVEIVFFDAIYENQMASIGEVLDEIDENETLFSVGSSGIEKALGDHWANTGLLKSRNDWIEIKAQKAILVLSGSCSPVTSAQINWAVKVGFVQIAVETEALENETHYIEKYANQIQSNLSAGKSVILHTCMGPIDLRLAQTQSYFENQGYGQLQIRKETAKRFGAILGRSARKALSEFPIERLVIAGGDTSSFVAGELGIEAVEMIAPVYLGAPLCRAYAKDSPVDGMEVNLKGGQVGDDAYFENLRRGTIN